MMTMNWLTKWRTKSVSPTWRYTTKGILWRLLPSEEAVFVIEDRNAESKTVTFAGIDAATGVVLWRDLRLEDDWWVSLQSTHHGVLFLHGYSAPDMPDPKKIIAVSCRTGALLWRNEDLVFLFPHEQCVYASKDEFEGRKFFELALLTGEVLREVEFEYLHVLEESIHGQGGVDVNFPRAIIHDGVAVPGANPGSLPSDASWTGHALVELLEAGDSSVVGYYEKKNNDIASPTFSQRLLVLHGESGAEIYQDLIMEDAVMCVPDTFFAIKDDLYYIKDKKTLIAIYLGGLKGKHAEN